MLVLGGEQPQGLAHLLRHQRIERKRARDHARCRTVLALRDDPQPRGHAFVHRRRKGCMWHFKLHTYRSYILYRFGVDKSIDAIAWSGVAAISTSFGLLRLFCRLAFAQSHTRAAAVLVDELDAGQLRCPSEHNDRLSGSYRPERASRAADSAARVIRFTARGHLLSRSITSYRTNVFNQHEQVARIGVGRHESEMPVERSSVVVFRVNGERTNADHIGDL